MKNQRIKFNIGFLNEPESAGTELEAAYELDIFKDI